MNKPERDALLELLKLDYERTAKLIEGVVSTGVTVRGWTITLTMALLGIGFDRQLWEMGAIALVLICMFALVDAYHSWLYAEALEHSGRVEGVLGLHYWSLASNHDPDADLESEVAIAAHKFGPFRNLTRFKPRSLLKARPRFGLVLLYGSLMIITGGTTWLIAHRARASTIQLACTPLDEQRATFRCVTK